MMQTGIMRLSEGGTPTGMTPQMAADFVSWFINKFGRGALGPQSWQAAKALWLKESGHATYGDSLKEYYPEANWDTYVNWVTSGQWNDTNTGGTGTDEPQTVFPAGSDVPSAEGYEENSIITIEGEGKYILTNNLWKKYEEPGSTDTGATEPIVLMDGASLPDASGYPEGQRIKIGDVIYAVFDGKWMKVTPDSREPNDGGGMFGLGIGPFLSDLFGVTGTGAGNVLSGIFGQDGNISDLIELFLKGKGIKGALDAIEYEVPTGQGAAMSDFEKANPFTGNMQLSGMGPNYLQGQDYGIPVGQQGIPAATHRIGKPFVEKVQGGQSGGIMNAKGHGDVVPALLEPDEFVFTRKAVQNMGGGDVRQGAKKMYSIMKSLEGMG